MKLREVEGAGELLVLLSYELPCSLGDLAGALSQELLIITMCDLVTSSISGVRGRLDRVYDRLLLFMELR